MTSSQSATMSRGRRTPGLHLQGRMLLERYLLVLVWLILAGFFAVTQPDSFLQYAAFQTIFGSSAVYVIVGLAALITSLVAEIDLSMAFVMGLCATVVPTGVAYWHLDVWQAAAIALLVGVACGFVNAVVVVGFRVNSLVATLGTGTIYLGVSNAISHQQPVAGLSHDFAMIAVTKFLGLPLTFWYGIVLALFLAYMISFTPFGRRMAFVGSNREVARLAGIRVNRVRAGAYAVGGLVAGFGGVLLAAQLGGFDPSSANSYLLPVFAILFLSSVVVRPGRFNPIGVVIGAYFIATGTLGLQLFGLTGWTQQVFYGGALVIAVAVVTTVRKDVAGH